MFNFARLFILFAIVYGIIFFVITNIYNKDSKIQNDFHDSRMFVTEEESDDYETSKYKDNFSSIYDSESEVSDSLKKQIKKTNTKTASKKTPQEQKSVVKYNPFEILGAYPDPTAFVGRTRYDKQHYGLINDDDYCKKVDLYNLAHPANMFKKMNFYTDYGKLSVMKSQVMSKIGRLYMSKVEKSMSKKKSESRTYNFDQKVTVFHISGDQFYKYHEIGKHYLCATQMFNHIPNHTNLIRKDEVLQKIE